MTLVTQKKDSNNKNLETTEGEEEKMHVVK